MNTIKIDLLLREVEAKFQIFHAPASSTTNLELIEEYGLVPGEIKHCFNNCILAWHQNENLTYCEGIATFRKSDLLKSLDKICIADNEGGTVGIAKLFPDTGAVNYGTDGPTGFLKTHHAWLVNLDREVIEPGPFVGEDYSGIPFDRQWLIQHCIKTEIYGVFANIDVLPNEAISNLF